jgi:hypothetical protein
MINFQRYWTKLEAKTDWLLIAMWVCVAGIVLVALPLIMIGV